MHKEITRIATPFNHVEVRVNDDNGQAVNRYVITPGDDYSNEPQNVQEVCNVYHTQEIIDAYKLYISSM